MVLAPLKAGSTVLTRRPCQLINAQLIVGWNNRALRQPKISKMANAQFEVTKGSKWPLEVKLVRRRNRRFAYLACALVLAVAAMYIPVSREDGLVAAAVNSTWGKWQRNRIEASQEELMRGCARQGFTTFDACFRSSLSVMGPG
jgi:hypothetical protein